VNSPPKLAQALLALSIPISNREPILGDFAEEYVRRSKQTGGSAQLWYWKQALLSFPYLIYGRIKASPMAVQVLLIGISYLIFLAWMFVVFYLFRLIYTTNIFKGHILLALSVRLLIESTGFIVSGALVRYGQTKLLPARHKKSLKASMGPILLILILLAVPTMLEYFSAEGLILKRYLLAKTIAIFPAVLLGAYAVQYFSQRSNK